MSSHPLLKLGPDDRAALERFLAVRPIDNCIALGLLGRHGFDGPVTFFGLYAQGRSDGLVGLVTLDRGRAMLLGDKEGLPRAVARLLEEAPLRSVFGQTSLIEALLRECGDELAAWRHGRQEVEQQMVLHPLLPIPLSRALPGIALSQVTAVQAVQIAGELALAGAQGGTGGAGAGRWSGETVSTLVRRLRYGFIQVARVTRSQDRAAAGGGECAAGDLAGLVWANMSAPHYPRLSRLWVREDLRGEGIATALLSEACQHLKRRGAVAVCAWVKQRDQAARHVLGKVGFLPGLLWKKAFPQP